MTDTFDYVKEATRTLSDKFYGDMVDGDEVLDVLGGLITDLSYLDKIKKSVFYGKDNNLPNESNIKLTNYINITNDVKQSVDLFHGIIGVATEVGELLEALRNAMEQNKRIDLVNLKEECGDLKWYLAIIAKSSGFKWGEDERINIAKLKARYPEKFTEEKAENRNLTTERKILEEKVEEKIIKKVID